MDGISEYTLSKKVNGRIGYADGHVELIVKVPIIGSVTLVLPAEDIGDCEKFLRLAKEHVEQLARAGTRPRAK